MSILSFNPFTSLPSEVDLQVHRNSECWLGCDDTCRTRVSKGCSHSPASSRVWVLWSSARLCRDYKSFGRIRDLDRPGTAGSECCPKWRRGHNRQLTQSRMVSFSGPGHPNRCSAPVLFKNLKHLGSRYTGICIYYPAPKLAVALHRCGFHSDGDAQRIPLRRVLGKAVCSQRDSWLCVRDLLRYLLWRQNGIVPAVICVAGAALIVSTYYVLRETPRPTSAVTPPGQITAIRSLLKFGTPFTASALVGTGMQFVMPALVLHLLNTESVGYYRAAFAISVNYLGFLITAMAQDYYPRVSAVRDQPVALASLINEQHRLVMTFAAPGILGTLALVPYLVPLVYSSKFMPTVEILEWQLIGDLFKFSSWTMAYVILAHCSGLTYFLTELLGGLVGIVTLIPAVRWFGLPGLGISFVVTYIIYFLAVWLIVRRDVPL